MSVREWLGQIASTKKPRLPKPVSCARFLTSAFTPALLTRYGARPPALPGPDIRPKHAEKTTTRPLRASTIGAAMMLSAQKTASKLIDITRRHSSFVVLMVFETFSLITPCASTRTSGTPKVVSISPKTFLVFSRFSRSSDRYSHCKVRAASTRRSSSLATKTIECPANLRALAVSKPKPREPPVIKVSVTEKSSRKSAIPATSV
ncbi:unannotated protein [freshwater metagenome]|uniref:Unannotated protein n=1 Tax=freshwater metagenome TaxID=449393 RepID=A0A6J6QF72_9ZZZZ